MLFFPHHPAALGYWERQGLGGGAGSSRQALSLTSQVSVHLSVTQALPTWDEQCSSFLI